MKVAISVFRCFLLLILIISLSGCKENNPITSTAQTPSAELSPILQTPTLGVLPAATPAKFRVTPTIELLNLEDVLRSPCLEIDTKDIVSIDLPWNLLVQQGLLLSTIDLQDNTKVNIPYFAERSADGGNKFYSRFVSTHRTWTGLARVDKMGPNEPKRS